MSPREKRSARDVALDALMQVDKANAWSDEALRRLIAQNGLDSRDAAFATRLCYGVMQNRMLLDYYIGCWCAQKPERLEPVIRSILRIGGYQILFMDRVPHRAAVNEAVEMTRRHGRPKAAGMVNAVLRRFVEHWMDMPDLPKGSTADYLSLRYSHPKWLVLRLLDLIGPDETQEFLRLDNDAVPTCIQVNPLKTTAEDLERELRGDGVTVQPHPWLEGCLEITGTGDLRSLPAFREGRFLVQDAAARLAAMAASAAPGDRVLDLGCGSGILFIGGMLLGAKEAYAVDIEENATRIARENAAENHLDPERYTISCGNIISDETLRQEIGSGYDVITANIVADVIKGMAPLFPGFLKDNGILILSGIITERADEVLDTVTAYDFAVLERREASGWCAVKLQKLAGAGTSCDTVRK